MSTTFSKITARPLFPPASSPPLNSKALRAKSSVTFCSKNALLMGAVGLLCRKFSSSFSSYRKTTDISSRNSRTLRSAARDSVSSWEESARIFFNRKSRSDENDQNEVKILVSDREYAECADDSRTRVSGGEEDESVRSREDPAVNLRTKFIKNRVSNTYDGNAAEQGDVSDRRRGRMRVSMEDDMKERSYGGRGLYAATAGRKTRNRWPLGYGDCASRVPEEEIQTKEQHMQEEENDVEGRNHDPPQFLKKVENSRNHNRSSKKFGERHSFTLSGDDDRVTGPDRSLTSQRTKENRSYVFEDEEESGEDIDDPRWKNIRVRSRNVLESREWGKQERWGKKVWAETTMSSTKLKLTGEGVYGISPVLAALSAGRREFYTLYKQTGMDLLGSIPNRKKKAALQIQRILDLAGEAGVVTKEASKHDLNMAVDSRPHQGFILDASPLEMVHVTKLDPVDPPGDPAGCDSPVWVALDEVTDPQNLGAIVRSAFFFGVTGVVVCAKNSAPLSGVVSKASSGSLEVVELRSCRNMMKFLTESSLNGWRVLGASVSPGATPLGEVPRGVPTVLVLGSEGSGLRVLVERSCSELVRITGSCMVDGGEGAIPPFFAVESLNVSVAAGVFLHHLVSKDH